MATYPNGYIMYTDSTDYLTNLTTADPYVWFDDATTSGTTGTSTTTSTDTYTLGANGYYEPVVWVPYDCRYEVHWDPAADIPNPPTILTPEQLAAIQQAQNELVRQEFERQEKQRVAQATREQKAEGLIKEILGELEYTAFKRRGYIDVPSSCDPTKRYRIRPYRMIGIVKLVNGEWHEQRQSLCIHPNEYGYAEGDVVATKLALCKFDEQTLLQQANLHQQVAA